MNQIDKILALQSRVLEVQSVLFSVEPEKASCISSIIAESEYLQTELSHEISSSTKLRIFASKFDTNSIETRISDLEALSDTVKVHNQKYRQTKIDNQMHRILESIQVFLKSYEALLEVHGHVLLTSEDYIVLAQALDGKYIILPKKDLNRHIVMIGKSGSGKSQAMISIIVQQLITGDSLVLLDPFGSLSRDLGSFIFAYQELRTSFQDIQSKIAEFFGTLFNNVCAEVIENIKCRPEFEKLSILKKLVGISVDEVMPKIDADIVDLSCSAKSNPYRINPFAPCKNLNIEDTVDILIEAIAREMGEDPNTTAQAANVLKSIFVLICSQNGTLNDILPILNTLRNYSGAGRNKTPLPVEILENLKNSDEPVARNYADYLERQLLSFSHGDFTSQVNSSRNRLSKLLDSSAVHRLFNCTQTTLDLETIFNSPNTRKTAVIFHISAEESGSSFLGHYIFKLIQKILYKRNDQQKKQRLSIWADEFHRYLGKSDYSADEVSTLFPSIRQHGGCLGVAFQQVSQLPSEKIHAAITENANCKIVFQSEGQTSVWASKTLWTNLGNLVEWSVSSSIGSGTVTGQSRSETKTEGISESQGISKSFTEGESKALGHTVSESFNKVITNSQSDSSSTSEGQSSGKSEGLGFHYHHPTGVEEISHSNSSVISANHTKNSSIGKSKTSGSSEGQTNGTSNSETNTKSWSKGKTETTSESISSSTANTIGSMHSINQNQSNGVVVKRMSLNEERNFIEQEIRGLKKRECFIYQDGYVVKAMTLDSITIKVAPLLNRFLENYYINLKEFQRSRISLLDEKNKASKPKVVNNQPDYQKPRKLKMTGTDGLF